MDTAYDHIQEENFPKNPEPTSPKPGEPDVEGEDVSAPHGSLNEEFHEAYKAMASSPWGMKLGGFWGTVKKASEQYIEEAQRINTAASSQATKGLTELISRTRSLSLTKGAGAEDENAGPVADSKEATDEAAALHPDRPDSLPADIVKEAQNIVSRFRTEAAKRLKDIELAEDAADEALLRFGTNIRSFLKDAVSIAPPTEITEVAANADGSGGNVLFESRDPEGKRTIHTSRLEAQLHVIHCNLDSFLKDPSGADYEKWENEFDADALNGRTAGISADLEKYGELRTAMEKLVPEKVDYATFWRRYYYLRKVAEGEEARRKELLKGAVTNVDEEVAWDEDSDDENNTPNAEVEGSTATLGKNTDPASANATPKAESKKKSQSKGEKMTPTLEPPKPHDVLSQPDSDASYDLVSAATSRAGGSPRDIKTVEEESDEDWE